MEMDAQELAVEMLAYLNEMGQYQNFLDVMEQKGFDIEQLEADIDKLENF